MINSLKNGTQIEMYVSESLIKGVVILDEDKDIFIHHNNSRIADGDVSDFHDQPDLGFDYVLFL